ncbi:MAG TPA: hypothetical protein VH253_18185 [Phycisphaerae bacterium]|nr:hypothetical protein [Phycisphaerae bacterium]
MSESPPIGGTGGEKCAECGVAIGRMDSPYMLNERTLCGSCYERLAGEGDVSSAETVVLPKRNEGIARKNDPLPFAALSQWRPDSPAYKRFQERERQRHKLRVVAAVGGIAAMAGMLTALVGGGSGSHAALAAGGLVMVVGLVVVFVALW